jgi:hypothetical protein
LVRAIVIKADRTDAIDAWRKTMQTLSLSFSSSKLFSYQWC